MLFRKKQPRSCTYCKFSTLITDEQVLCSKCGIRAPDSPCRKFRYDPIKRIPPTNIALDTTKYSQEDFII